MRFVRCIALLLIIVGAVNWGLVGFFQYNLVADLFGGVDSIIARVIFGIVGLAGLYAISFLCRCGCCASNCTCSCCKKGHGDHHNQPM